MASRLEHKQASRMRILDAAAERIRTEGLSGAAIAQIMKDSGLTHGAFYAHFNNKSDLCASAIGHSLVSNRKRWIGKHTEETWAQRLRRLATRYLNKKHRDDLSTSCALSALASESARADRNFKKAYEVELKKSLSAIADAPFEQLTPWQYQQTLSFMALCIGGMTLSRAVDDEHLSADILNATNNLAKNLTLNEEKS
ncbi:MAG: TetR/AcrR family transcriptional regulator [Agarilytica sp.]